MQIYRDSFEPSQREDEMTILKNITSNNYKMFSLVEKGKVIGFYILDISEKLNYALLTFLAVKKSLRGKGVGSQLSLHAINYFHKSLPSQYLLIEAESRQAKLYAKLGFKILDIDYNIPKFDSEKSLPMHLMLITKDLPLDAITLTSIIKDIFCRGYSLSENDPRLEEQLTKIIN